MIVPEVSKDVFGGHLSLQLRPKSRLSSAAISRLMRETHVRRKMHLICLRRPPLGCGIIETVIAYVDAVCPLPYLMGTVCLVLQRALVHVGTPRSEARIAGDFPVPKFTEIHGIPTQPPFMQLPGAGFMSAFLTSTEKACKWPVFHKLARVAWRIGIALVGRVYILRHTSTL